MARVSPERKAGARRPLIYLTARGLIRVPLGGLAAHRVDSRTHFRVPALLTTQHERHAIRRPALKRAGRSRPRQGSKHPTGTMTHLLVGNVRGNRGPRGWGEMPVHKNSECPPWCAGCGV